MTLRWTTLVGAGASVTAALTCGGCERVTRDMAEQPRAGTDQPSAFFSDGAEARRLPQGTLTMPPSSPPSHSANAADEVVERGRTRYAIYCVPCHGPQGAGDGEVVRRGFPAPPPLHISSPGDQHWVTVIRDGRGRMNGFADRLTEEDARTIVAFVAAAGWGGPP
jgi:mono/diheme cytochrome c family protein